MGYQWLRYRTHLIYEALVCLDEVVVESIVAEIANSQCVGDVVDPKEYRKQRIG